MSEPVLPPPRPGTPPSRPPGAPATPAPPALREPGERRAAQPRPRRRPRRWRAELALVVTAFAWGTTFVVVEDAVESMEPLPFIAGRFLLAALILGVAARVRRVEADPARHAGPHPHRVTPHEWRDGIAAGATLGAGYVFQTVGLQYTSPSTSAFITYLLVVFVPVVGFVALRRRPHPATLAGTVVSLVGLVVLTAANGAGTGGTTAGLGRGELLTMGCAVAFAVHLVLLGEVAHRHDPVRLTYVQLLTVGLATLAVDLVTRAVVALDGNRSPALLPLDARVLGALVFTGVFATALAFLLMVWGQQVVPAARAALIFLLEPVFAALVSWLTGERLTLGGVAGGGLILAGVLVAELAPGALAGREPEPRAAGGRQGTASPVDP